MSFSREGASGKYPPYSSPYCRKTGGDLGESTDEKVSKIFKKLYFIESSIESIHNKENEKVHDHDCDDIVQS